LLLETIDKLIEVKNSKNPIIITAATSISQEEIPIEWLNVVKDEIGKGRTRATLILGGWILEPIDPYDVAVNGESLSMPTPSTRATCYARIDLGGSIPHGAHPLLLQGIPKCVNFVENHLKQNVCIPYVRYPSIPFRTNSEKDHIFIYANGSTKEKFWVQFQLKDSNPKSDKFQLPVEKNKLILEIVVDTTRFLTGYNVELSLLSGEDDLIMKNTEDSAYPLHAVIVLIPPPLTAVSTHFPETQQKIKHCVQVFIKSDDSSFGFPNLRGRIEIMTENLNGQVQVNGKLVTVNKQDLNEPIK